MPPFNCSVEVRPQGQYLDPTSIDWTRRMRGALAERSERFSDLRYAKFITFTLDASDIEAAREQVGQMCDMFLVNNVYEEATVSIVVAKSDEDESTDS